MSRDRLMRTAMFAVVAAMALPPRLEAQDSSASASALRALVSEAAAANRRAPESLTGYTAAVESELAVGFRDTTGTDHTTQVEQAALSVRWHRSGWYDLHIVGYRSQLLGPSPSMLSFLRGWTVPVLYGNRLRLGLVADTTPRRGLPSTRRRGMDSRGAVLVHPFAQDRDRFYQFQGGDTVTVLRSRLRSIPVVRVRVAPRIDADTSALLFQGDIDLDAQRREIVRMRGKIVRVERGKDLGGVTGSGRLVAGVGYIEFENAEVEGRYWLPAYQRTEMQGEVAGVGDVRSVFRILSRFRDVAPNSPAVLTMTSRVDSARWDSYRLSRATQDSIASFSDWQRALGEANRGVTADDFSDLAPRSWSRTGPPALELRARRLSDLARFNRVEGLYTGVAGRLRLRDRAPGVTLRGNVGWAWAERTVRGGLTAEWQRGAATWIARAERTLASTADFSGGASSASSVGALIASVDNDEWLDRRVASAAFIRSSRSGKLRILAELAAAEDRAAVQHATRGAFGSDTGFRPLRGVRDGSYARSRLILSVNPRVSGVFLDEGAGAELRWERGEGELHYDRLDLDAASRMSKGPFTAWGGLSAAAAFGEVPPQQLVELGSAEGLEGYGYRPFTGDRGAVAGVGVMYRLPIRTPPLTRLGSRLILPGISPSLLAGLHGGWTEISGSTAAAASAELLTPQKMPVRGTGGIRATFTAGLSFFSGAVTVGAARPVDGFHDRRNGWRFLLTLGQTF